MDAFVAFLPTNWFETYKVIIKTSAFIGSVVSSVIFINKSIDCEDEKEDKITITDPSFSTIFLFTTGYIGKQTTHAVLGAIGGAVLGAVFPISPVVAYYMLKRKN